MSNYVFVEQPIVKFALRVHTQPTMGGGRERTAGAARSGIVVVGVLQDSYSEAEMDEGQDVRTRKTGMI